MSAVTGPNPTRRVTLLINGKQLSSWTRVRIVRGLHEICGSFELEYIDAGRDAETSNAYQTNAADFAPLEAGAHVQLLIDGEAVLVGWIDKIKLKQTAELLHAGASGRDICGDLVDCAALPNGPADFTNITVDVFTETVCAPFKIGVQVQTDVGAPFPKLSVTPHEKAMPSIEKFCRQRSILVVSDGVANVLLTTAGSTRAPDQIQVGVNVYEADYDQDNSKRFSDVFVKGQTSGANGNHASVPAPITPATAPGVDAPGEEAEEAEASGIVMTGHAQDTQITRWRPDVRMVKTQSGSSTVQEQAEWHVRVDRGTATKTAYKVLDWRAGTANALWRPNQLTAVYDPFAEIDCDMLIEQVEYLYSEKEGAVTMLRIVPPAAYERINESSRQQSRHGQKSRK
jgi:prophage tail gpP-like protein